MFIKIEFKVLRFIFFMFFVFIKWLNKCYNIFSIGGKWYFRCLLKILFNLWFLVLLC